jgi:hypothetical protein
VERSSRATGRPPARTRRLTSASSRENVSGNGQNAIVEALKAKFHRRFGSIHGLVLIPRKGSTKDARVLH